MFLLPPARATSRSADAPPHATPNVWRRSLLARSRTKAAPLSAPGTALVSTRYFTDATGVFAVPFERAGPVPSAVVVVGAPRRFGCLWRTTWCSRALAAHEEQAVLVAARQPAPFSRALVVLRAAPGDVDAVPAWLRAIPRRALAIALDAPSFIFPHGSIDVPCAFGGVGDGLEQATRAAASIERRARRALGIGAAITSPGTIVDAVRAAAAKLGAFDLICVEGRDALGFGLFLRECIDRLSAAVLVLPSPPSPCWPRPAAVLP